MFNHLKILNHYFHLSLSFSFILVLMDVFRCIFSAQRRDDSRNNMGGRNGPRGNGFGGGRPNEYGGSWDRRQGGGPMQDKVETTFTVPATKCGIIIGKGGETIKQINMQTGAHCELDRRNQSNENEKIFIIRGNPEQVEHAKRIFSEKLGMVSFLREIQN